VPASGAGLDEAQGTEVATVVIPLARQPRCEATRPRVSLSWLYHTDGSDGARGSQIPGVELSNGIKGQYGGVGRCHRTLSRVPAPFVEIDLSVAGPAIRFSTLDPFPKIPPFQANAAADTRNRKPPIESAVRLDPRGISSAGRALAWHARGHEFESRILHFGTDCCGVAHARLARRCAGLPLRFADWSACPLVANARSLPRCSWIGHYCSGLPLGGALPAIGDGGLRRRQ
jgi:hypothetical protein